MDLEKEGSKDLGFMSTPVKVIICTNILSIPST